MMENYYKYLLTNVSLNSFPRTHQKKIASINFLLYVDNAWTLNYSRKPLYILALHFKPWAVFYKHKNNNNNNNNSLNNIWVKNLYRTDELSRFSAMERHFSWCPTVFSSVCLYACLFLTIHIPVYTDNASSVTTLLS